MDEIRFEIGERDEISEELVDEVVIFINGRNLIDLVRKIEQPFAARDGKPRLAGGYAGPPPEAVFPPSRRFLGRPDAHYDEWDGGISVLGCECGVVGCWPLLVRISVTEDRIVWSNFEQPHRRRWHHDELGPFVFDRTQYLTALGQGPQGSEN